MVYFQTVLVNKIVVEPVIFRDKSKKKTQLEITGKFFILRLHRTHVESDANVSMIKRESERERNVDTKMVIILGNRGKYASVSV